MESRTGGSDSGNVFDELPVNHGAPRRRRRSSTATDFRTDTSGEAFDRRSHKRSSLEFDERASLWADLHSDILGIVLRLLPYLADRASVRSVCRHWRSGARSHVLPPPLPLLVLPMFKFSSLSSGGALRLLRSVPIPEEVGSDHVRFVGSFDEWLVGVTPNKDRSERYRHADGECFLRNALTNAMGCLPNLCTLRNDGYSCKILPITNGFGNIYFSVNAKYMMSVHQVVLSASPECGSKYVVAASSYYLDGQNIALWQPGMMSWHVSFGFSIVGLVDLAFYQGKLYVLHRPLGHLCVFELEEDDRGVIVSHVEFCLAQPLPPQLFEHSISSNIVVWRGNLLKIIRYYDRFAEGEVVKVDVFALDFSRNRKGLIKIHNFDGDYIFVDLGGCKFFPARLNDGVEGDRIYFVPDFSTLMMALCTTWEMVQ